MAIESAKSWEDAMSFEVAIVGGGPKGLAAQSELVRLGVRSVVLEAASHTGQHWSQQRMHENRLVTPEDIEIVINPDLKFRSYREKNYPAQINQKPTANQFYNYLNWLKENLPDIQTQTKVDNIDFCGGEFHLKCGHKNIKSQNLILATGVSGYGGTEFAHYPLDSRESALISHYPAKLVHPKEIQEFIGRTESLAIIGGNITGLETLKEACHSAHLQQIHVIACGEILAKDLDTVKALELDETRKSILKLLIEELPCEDNSPKRFYYPFQAPEMIEEKGEKVDIELPSGGKLSVDRVILATGFQYDFRAPFLTEGLLRSYAIKMAPNGRHADPDSNQRLLTTSGQSLPLYVMGEGAAALGERFRRLPSTLEEVRKITTSILGGNLISDYVL